MLIKPEEINGIIRKAGEKVAAKGKSYYEQDKITIKKATYISDEKFRVQTFVKGNYIYEPFICRDKGILRFACNCPTFSEKKRVCKHIVATAFDMYVSEEKYIDASKKDFTISIFDEEKLEKNRYKNQVKKEKNHVELLEYYENLNDGLNDAEFNISVIPILKEVKVDELFAYFRIGSKKMYNIKDLNEFSLAIRNKSILEHGKDFAFKHDICNFSDDSKPLVKFIYKKILEYENYGELSKNELDIKKEYRKFISLKYSALDEFFSINEGNVIGMEDDNKLINKIKLITDDPVLNFKVTENDDGIYIEHDYEAYKVYYGSEYVYILLDNVLYRCSDEFKKDILPLIQEFRNVKDNVININKENAAILFETVIPVVSKSSTVNVDQNLKDKYKSENLGVKVFLDINAKKHIIAKIKYCYDKKEFNPFDSTKGLDISRNKRQEERVKKLFDEYKFRIDADKYLLYISDDNDIYQFFKTGLDKFMEKFEVLVTEKLKNKTIIGSQSVNMGVRLENNLINIDISNVNFDEKELKEIFEKYKLKQKYYRLKDGSFINLDSSLISTLYNITTNLGVNYKDITKGNLKVPKYRAMYLDNLGKKNEDIIFNKDSSFSTLINDISNSDSREFEVPSLENASLRIYQKNGYSWLKTLDSYGFGGILADDMGLGKTIQVIALLENERITEKKTSIVICPSSLYINWENEIKKFAPKIKTLIINGNQQERQEKIEKATKYDVIITSYDLLKRDVLEYQKYNFRYIIADEAQYIKNNNTKNAQSLKELNGNIRFALTGTPIENSLSELWSIFDFIMPGYLYTYRNFKEVFENPIIKENDDDTMRRLQLMVAPFVLRRTKTEVLKELPEKTVTVMYNEMEEEQAKVYKNYLLTAKKEIRKELDEDSEVSNMKILSLITRLRQIASHPSMFLEDYEYGSSKVNQCVELVKEAISSGHKMLIFSSFTSIFDILEKELEKNDIKYFKLTGQTKVDTRVSMVDEFNKSDDVPVFLVSLKAGGTGLNLIGADMVIHFDPWWNMSQENQATDRAYRIGQRNNVQVFKLITKGTIEEKIQELQDKKSKITDSVIKSGETFINKMSKEEILKLFE